MPGTLTLTGELCKSSFKIAGYELKQISFIFRVALLRRNTDAGVKPDVVSSDRVKSLV